MAITVTATEVFVEIGFTALRGPDGGFLPSLPLYAKVPAADVSPKTGQYSGEDALLRDVGNIFADKYRQYLENGGTPSMRKQRKPKGVAKP